MGVAPKRRTGFSPFGSMVRRWCRSRVALFWLLGGQAEEGGEQGRVGLPDQMPDKLWGPAHDQAAAEASELASVSEARTGDALAGVPACLGGFVQRCVTERRSGSARSRSLGSGVELSCAKADESGALGAGARV